MEGAEPAEGTEPRPAFRVGSSAEVAAAGEPQGPDIGRSAVSISAEALPIRCAISWSRAIRFSRLGWVANRLSTAFICRGLTMKSGAVAG